jgi:uncharacterized protein
VDDILANIRRSVEQELDSLTTGAAKPRRGSMMREALSTMVEPPSRSPRDDILDLRSRIKRKVEAMELEQPASLAPLVTYQPPQRRDFSDIMAGEPWQEPDLRPSLAEDHEANDDINYAAHQQQQWPVEYTQYDEPQYEEHLPTPLMSPDTEAQAQSAFHALSETMDARHAAEQTFEAMTRDMLHGMLRQWLDENLPAMVEEIVREEIQRVARRGR